MDVYNSEQEQLEAIKKWWKENGLAVVLGLTVGLGGLFGWRHWEQRKADAQEQASVGFQQVMSAVVGARVKEAESTAEKLRTEHADSAYAGLAALKLARLAVEAGKLEQAEKELRWALDNAPQPEVKEAARARLARVLLAQNRADDAWTLVDQAPVIVESAAMAELKGDIRVAQGKAEEARALYLRALALAPVDPEADTTPLQLKLDDVGGGANAVQ